MKTAEDTMNMAKMEEAIAIIKALTPRSAPDDLHLIKGLTGLNIIKNVHMPSDTIMVSKDIFDRLFESTQED